MTRVFVGFLTAGFPQRDSTVDLMFALEAGGTDIIELGVPFSDPIGDGPVVQAANTVSGGRTPRLPHRSLDPRGLLMPHRWPLRMESITQNACATSRKRERGD